MYKKHCETICDTRLIIIWTIKTLSLNNTDIKSRNIRKFNSEKKVFAKLL